MKKYIFLIVFFAFTLVQGQSRLSSEKVNGAYIALEAEKGSNGPTKNKVIELAENNGTQILAIAACETCFPAIYTFNQNLSEQFGKPVFTNSMGIYSIVYDDKSFVVVVPSLKLEENFSFLNFYSKDKDLLLKMTKNKIEKYAIGLLDFL